jgi:hypothetical protein
VLNTPYLPLAPIAPEMYINLKRAAIKPSSEPAPSLVFGRDLHIYEFNLSFFLEV